MDWIQHYWALLSHQLHEHPHWALLASFLVAFSESIFLIGILVPGAVLITSIAIMAGSGIIRIDLTYLVTTLGAFVSDCMNFFLAYSMRDKIPSTWPFSNYPTWISSGSLFFKKHGAKSIAIGRFIGPLRGIVPLIAGMMHMHWPYFILVDLLSSVIWCVAYVTPGVLIGFYSGQLSLEEATHLVAWCLLALVALGFLIKTGQYLYRIHKLNKK